MDDEPEICFVLAEALGAVGLDVAAAASGTEAADLARRHRPDLVIADIRLGDCSGLELVDRLREDLGEMPAVFITGYGDAAAMAEASRRRPVEVINKPIDLSRLRQTVREELHRQEQFRRIQQRNQRLRELTRRIIRRRGRSTDALNTACADLTATCRNLQSRLDRQRVLIEYQNELMGCNNDDDVFRLLFRLFVQRSGPVFGVSVLCDAHAELQMVGRFGVPHPDGANFCQALATAVVPTILAGPEVTVLDAFEHLDMFPEAISGMLIGVTLMAVPLLIGESRLIGIVVLYRKGEQPFTPDDMDLADMIAPATAAAVQRT